MATGLLTVVRFDKAKVDLITDEQRSLEGQAVSCSYQRISYCGGMFSLVFTLLRIAWKNGTLVGTFCLPCGFEQLVLNVVLRGSRS